MIQFKQKVGEVSIGVFADGGDMLIAILQKDDSWGCVFVNEGFPVYLETIESIAAKLRELNKEKKGQTE